jgi:hypothetical protein
MLPRSVGQTTFGQERFRRPMILSAFWTCAPENPFLDVKIEPGQREDDAYRRRVSSRSSLSDVRINDVLEYEILPAHRVDVQFFIRVHRNGIVCRAEPLKSD